MTTLQRKLPLTFTDPAGLPIFVPTITTLPVAGVVRRYSALQAAATTPLDSPVTSIPNLGSGVGAVTAPSDTQRPTLRLADGRIYLAFDGIDDVLTAPTVETIASGSPVTMYAVARIRSLPAGATYYNAAGYGGGRSVPTVAQSGYLQAYWATTMSAPILIPGTGWHVFITVANNADGSAAIRMDDTETTGTAGTVANSTAFRLSTAVNGATYSPVDIIEAGAYTKALTPTERTALADHLATLYAL